MTLIETTQVNITPAKNDPLLTGAKIITGLACGFLMIALVAVSIGAIAVPTAGYTHVAAEFAKVGAPLEGIWLLSGVLLLIAAMLFMGIKFLLELFAIIKSVGEEEPFHPENARRLNRMGWFALAGQGITLPIMAIAGQFSPYLLKAGRHHNFGFGIDLGTILLILILFILARVFRKGAEMREEMEGTV